jgi:hypothetical protein
MIGEALREGAGHVTPWIAASGWLSGVTTYYLLQAFTLARRTTLLIVSMIAPALANVVLNLLLIPMLGLDGALWATTPATPSAPSPPGPWAAARCHADPLGDPGQGRRRQRRHGPVRPRPARPGGVLELGLKAGVGALVYGVLVLGLDVGGLRGKLSLILRRRASAL